MKQLIFLSVIFALFSSYALHTHAAEYSMQLAEPSETGFQVGDTISVEATPGLVVLSHTSGKQIFIPINADGKGSYTIQSQDMAGNYQATLYTDTDQSAPVMEQSDFLSIQEHDAEATEPKLQVVKTEAQIIDKLRNQLTSADSLAVVIASSEQSLKQVTLIGKQGEKTVQQPLKQNIWTQDYEGTMPFREFSPDKPIQLTVEAVTYAEEKGNIALEEQQLTAAMPVETALQVQLDDHTVTKPQTILYTGQKLMLRVQAPYDPTAFPFMSGEDDQTTIPLDWQTKAGTSQAVITVPPDWSGKELQWGNYHFLARTHQDPFRSLLLIKNDKSQQNGTIFYQNTDTWRLTGELWPEYQMIAIQQNAPMVGKGRNFQMDWNPLWSTIKWQDWDGSMQETVLPWDFSKTEIVEQPKTPTKKPALPAMPLSSSKPLEPAVKVPLKTPTPQKATPLSKHAPTPTSAVRPSSPTTAKHQKRSSTIPYWLGGAVLIGFVIVSGNRAMKL